MHSLKLPKISLNAVCLVQIASFAMFGLLVAGCKKQEANGAAGSKTPHQKPSQPTATEKQPDQQLQEPIGLLFTDVTDSSNIDFEHFYDGQGGYYIAEPIASGIVSFDFDNDGRCDIYFLNGHTLPAPQATDPTNQLFRNAGGFHFSKVPQATHDARVRFSVGAAAADFNQDGFEDLFVNNVGENSLYLNLGDGTFAEVAAESGVPMLDQCGAGVAFADLNGDTHLDLFIGNYVVDPIKENIPRTTDGFRSYPGPLDFAPAADVILLNNADGTFRDHTEESGISKFASTTMGLASWDFDQDGDLDVIVMNDVDANSLLQNDGTARFTNVAIEFGVAFSYDAQRNGNMGVELGDFNRDGLLDVFSTTYSNDLPVLYQATPEHMFLDVAVRTKAGTKLGPHANWGTAFSDFDLDGDDDLFVANGHTDPSVGKWAFNTSWKVKNTLLENVEGSFREIGNGGSGLAPVESSRGVCVEDFDNDGDADIVVLNALAKPTVLRNDSTRLGESISIRLIDPRGIRDGTGCVVSAHYADGQVNARVCLSGRGYQSGYGRNLLFGASRKNPLTHFEVKWPDGELTHHPASRNLQQKTVITRESN